jgi:hypothetical protein
MTIRRLLSKLAGLSLQDWRDLFAAQWALVVAQAAVWLRPRGSLVSSAVPGEPAGAGAVEPAVEALARAVDRAARFGPVRAKCLVRSIALARLIEKRGYEGAIVRVGVLRTVESFFAHAWVEYRGAVLGHDKYVVHKFERLPGIDVDF